MAGLRATSCCGLGEISGLSYPPTQKFETQLKAIVITRGLIRTSNYGTPSHFLTRGAIIFTSNTKTKNNYAQKFSKGIVDNELGTVKSFPSFKNPNTTRPITVYLWTIDEKALIAFCKKHKWF